MLPAQSGIGKLRGDILGEALGAARFRRRLGLVFRL